MERIDKLINKWGHKREIIMPQNYQQYSDASCNVNILDSIGQEDSSSLQILPCEFKYRHALYSGVANSGDPGAGSVLPRRPEAQRKSLKNLRVSMTQWLENFLVLTFS